MKANGYSHRLYVAPLMISVLLGVLISGCAPPIHDAIKKEETRNVRNIIEESGLIAGDTGWIVNNGVC